MGNAVKYISRAGKKDPAKKIEDLQKAAWYIDHEIKRLQMEEEKIKWIQDNAPTINLAPFIDIDDMLMDNPADADSCEEIKGQKERKKE